MPWLQIPTFLLNFKILYPVLLLLLAIPHKVLRLLGTLVLSQQFQVVFALLAVLVAPE